MSPEKQQQIADSFSQTFEEFDLNLNLPVPEFDLFNKGMFATSMDEKWNIFVIDNYLFLSRSWTGHCIYKISIIRQPEFVRLNRVLVTRDKTKYRGDDLEQDRINLLRVLQVYLGRDDLYVDPEFELELIKKAILKYDPNNECKKSIGHNTVGLTKQIYDGLTTKEQKNYVEVSGWAELRKNIIEKSGDEPLLSLYLQNKNTNSSITYYFNKEGDRLLGQITIKEKERSTGLFNFIRPFK